MPTTREAYKVNHSDMRALARYATDPQAKLKALCAEREFWFGGRWSLPASAGAQAALIVLNHQHGDSLANRAVILDAWRRAGAATCQNLKLLSGLMRANNSRTGGAYRPRVVSA